MRRALRFVRRWLQSGMPDEDLERVQRELRKYEHPLLVFEARRGAAEVEVLIRFKDPSVQVHTYVFSLHARDLEHVQFSWTFQRQLYDCLHDYFIEMFTRTPQSRRENSQLEREAGQ